MRTRPRLITAAVVVAMSITAFGGVADAQPPTTPGPPPTQLSPQSPGGGGSGEQIPIGDAPTGGVRWDQFGGDPAGAPQNLDSFIDTTLGWLRTIAGFSGVLGLLICAALTFIGIRGRSEGAKKAMHSVPFVLAGTVLAGSATAILTVII